MASSLIAGLSLATAVQANPLTYTSYSLTGPESYIHITDPANPSNPYDHTPRAGGFDAPTGIGQIVLHTLEYGDVPTWCIDVAGWLYDSGTYNTGAPTLSHDLLGRIGALVDYGNAHVNDLPDMSGAVQVAIWEIEYPTYQFWNQTREGVVGLANELIRMDLAPQYGFLELTADGRQSLIMAPEPLSLFLFGSGLLGLGLIRRRG